MPKDKKIAILMLCHIFPNQINDFIDKLDDGHFDFFIHADKKSDIQASINKRSNVYFVSDEKRVDVRWGQYSMVEATLQLIEVATRADKYDYYWLCSGQDFPIRSTEEIYHFLQISNCNYISLCSSRNNPIKGYRDSRFDKRCEVLFPSWLIGKTVWQRSLMKMYKIATGGTGHTFSVFKRNPPLDLELFFGSQWWCLKGETISWIYEFLIDHNEVCEFFKKTICPDECFFHTLVMNSPYKDDVEPNLVYLDWVEGKSSPRILNISDYKGMMESGKLLVRKIDSEIELELYHVLTDRKAYDCG